MRFTLIFSLLLYTLDIAAAETRQDAPPRSEAEQLFATAMRFELDGENRYRNMTLRAAIKSEGDFPPAHWQLGEIDDQGVWKSVTSLALADDAAIQAYGERRDQALGNSEAEFALAKWCWEHNLKDRARFHYARVAFDPSASEAHRSIAIRRTKLKAYHGTLVNEEQYAALQTAEREYQNAIKRWDPKMTKWRETLLGSSDRKRDKAMAELARIQTADAIPSLERILTPAAEHIALHVIEVLDRIPHHEATMSFVRHAVGAPWPSVVEAATAALKKRPIHEYVPALLSGLDTPVYFRAQTPPGNFAVTGPLGSAPHQFPAVLQDTVVFKEGLDHNLLIRNRHLSGPMGQVLVVRNGGNGPVYYAPHAFAPPNDRKAIQEQVLGNAIRAELERKQLRASVATNNLRIEQMNAQLFSILESTTGQILPQDATAWWDWWHDYNEVSSAGYGETKPTYVSVSYTSNIPVVVRASCFLVGTPVWTDLGQRPIESLEIGDRVLSQHPDTGELNFQLVTGHTLRPPTEIVDLELGDEVISVTKGHPFWLNGEGWRMAKLLEPNQRLHSVHGSVTVTSVTPAGKQEAHNLVVAGTGTYFVGTRGLLVHDNTYRKPTRAMIPGFQTIPLKK